MTNQILIGYQINSIFSYFRYPIIQNQNLVEIYKVNTLSTFQDKKRLTPVIATNFFGLYKFDMSFRPLLREEVTRCLNSEGSECLSSLPRYDKKHATCEMAFFYKNDTSNEDTLKKCNFKEDKSMMPSFLTLQSTVYFSTPTPLTVNFECASVESKTYPDQQIKSMSFFHIPKLCIGKIKSLGITLTPGYSMRIVEKTMSTSRQNNTMSPNGNGKNSLSKSHSSLMEYGIKLAISIGVLIVILIVVIALWFFWKFVWLNKHQTQNATNAEPTYYSVDILKNQQNDYEEMETGHGKVSETFENIRKSGPKKSNSRRKKRNAPNNKNESETCLNIEVPIPADENNSDQKL